jgi:hypothetical protein
VLRIPNKIAIRKLSGTNPDYRFASYRERSSHPANFQRDDRQAEIVLGKEMRCFVSIAGSNKVGGR